MRTGDEFNYLVLNTPVDNVVNSQKQQLKRGRGNAERGQSRVHASLGAGCLEWECLLTAQPTVSVLSVAVGLYIDTKATQHT